IAGKVLEHHGLARIDTESAEETVIGGPFRLRHQAGRDNIENIVEIVEDSELARRAFGMAAITVGEDEATARQRFDCLPERRIWGEPGIVDIMDLLQKVVRVDL